MGNKHKVLNENTFRNSKYIQVVNKQIGCNDFKNFCEDNKDVNDTIRMYKKGKIWMYKIVHIINPKVHSFVIL